MPSYHQRAGVGSYFSGIYRDIKPLSKPTIENSNKEVKKDKKPVKKETAKAAVNPPLQVLEKKKVTKKLPASKDQKLTKSEKVNRKRKLKSNNSSKRKIPLIDDDY